MAPTIGVSLYQAPIAMALMLATELFRLRRIAAGCRPVTHSGQFDRREQLKLPHE
jgi:hypothetical protein